MSMAVGALLRGVPSLCWRGSRVAACRADVAGGPVVGGTKWGPIQSPGRRGRGSGRRALTGDAGLQPVRSGQSTGGQLEVIVGPMFAGKSTLLMRRVQELKDEGLVCVVAKSRTDTREVAGGGGASEEGAFVSTHDGLKLGAVSASSLSEFRDLVGDEAWAKTSVVAVDEAQFFPDLVEMCCRWADHDAKHVVVAGLDGDFRRRVFGDSSSTVALVPLADTVTKLLARCEACGGPAPFTARRTAEDQAPDAAQIRVGGADVYVPLCRHHYLQAMDGGAHGIGV